MPSRGGNGHPRRRCGAAVAEFALLLPLLCFLFVVAIDFSRVFYYSVTITSCARNGALYASDPVAAAESPYTSTQQAALAEASGLSPQPTVSSATGTDADGHPSATVTVSYPFQTITNYPGIPATLTLTRSVQMRVAATVPSSP